jgi:hypothetical protein
MVPVNDDKAVTEVVNLISRDAAGRKALADALASCDPDRLQRAVRSACGLELSTEVAAKLTSRDRLVSTRQRLFML